MDTSLLLMVWTTALLFLLVRTNSFKTSISTSLMVVALFVISVLHRLYGEVGCLFIMVAVLSVLVARVIPHDTIDKWKKECC